MRNGMKSMLEASADTLHRAHAAGVTMAMGTDSGFSVTPYGIWHARELELLMTYAGMSSVEAIKAGTSNGALMLGLQDRIGVVAPGMIADLIVVATIIAIVSRRAWTSISALALAERGYGQHRAARQRAVLPRGLLRRARRDRP